MSEWQCSLYSPALQKYNNGIGFACFILPLFSDQNFNLLNEALLLQHMERDSHTGTQLFMTPICLLKWTWNNIIGFVSILLQYFRELMVDYFMAILFKTNYFYLKMLSHCFIYFYKMLSSHLLSLWSVPFSK